MKWLGKGGRLREVSGGDVTSPHRLWEAGPSPRSGSRGMPAWPAKRAAPTDADHPSPTPREPTAPHAHSTPPAVP